MATPFPGTVWTILDASGNQVQGAKVYTYAAGTLTAKAVYTTAALSVACSNPVIADGSGRVQFFMGSGTYRFRVFDASDVEITGLAVDNVTAADDISANLAASSGSSLVGFVQSGTGTAARTVQAKLRELGVFASDFSGYDPTGVLASDSAIAAAIAQAAAQGLYTVYITGTPKIASAISYSNKLALVGVGAGGFFTNDPTTFPVRILCGGVTGYVFDQPDVADGSGALTLENICFDGKSGSIRSTTLQGIVKASTTAGQSSFFLRMRNCMVGGSDSATAILDLSGEVFAEFNNCFFRDWPNGYGHKGGLASILGTTTTFNKCYWNSCRQVGEWLTNITDVTYNDCVMESCVVGVAAAYANVTFNSLYSENMGYDPSGTSTTTGLTPRSFGIGDSPAITGNVSAVFTCRYGQMTFNQPTLQNTTGGKKWFDGIGRSGATNGGSIKVKEVSFAAGSIATLFTADSDTPSSRENFEYEMTAKPSFGAYVSAADARMLTKGRVPLLWSDSNVRPVEVDAGIFTLPALSSGGLTALPTIAPSGGTNAVGDRVKMAPSQYTKGTRTAYRCIVGGSAAASRWAIDEFISSSSSGSVANAATLTVTASAKDNPGEVHVWQVMASTGANIESHYRVSMQAFSGAGQLGIESIVTTRALTFAITWGDPYTITVTNASGVTLNVYARLISVTSTVA